MLPSRQNLTIFFIGLVFCTNAIVGVTGSKLIKTSAKSLAEKAGATQYAVHLEEQLTSEEIDNGQKHYLKKRLTTDNNAFDDTDYEIYQGVVGRPGIDFPILSGIPQTTFNCRKFGNGYFADLETQCQVFHICESGKKISFLCPNGTIFLQTELICDWWFRVNCNASPGHYADTSIELARAQNQRIKKLQIEFESNVSDELQSEDNDDGDDDENASTSVDNNKNDNRHRQQQTQQQQQQQQQQQKQRQRRKQQTNQQYQKLPESYDFEDIQESQPPPPPSSKPPPPQIRHQVIKSIKSTDRIPKDLKSIGSPNDETQEVAESAGFASSGQHFNQLTGNNAAANGYNYPKPTVSLGAQSLTANNRRQQKTSRTQQKFSPSAAVSTSTTTVTLPPSTTSARGSKLFENQNQLPPTANSINPSVEKVKFPATRRLYHSSSTTPYYTPTVPSIIRRQSSTTGGSSSTTAVPPFSPEKPLSPAVGMLSTEDALKMIKTLHEITDNNDGDDNDNEDDDNGNINTNLHRPGLIVPPSSGPDTLHSLALYFATAVDNLGAKNNSTQSNDQTVLPLEFLNNRNAEIPIAVATVATSSDQNVSSALLSNHTVDRYEILFGIKDKKDSTGGGVGKAKALTVTATRIACDDLQTDSNSAEQENGLETAYSNNLAATPQIREIAQVFTHALSAYLHDPKTFRRVLSEIRPTEPPPPSTSTISKSQQDYLSNRIGRTKKVGENSATTSYENGISTTEALEVLDFSDVTISTIHDEPTTTAASLSSFEYLTSTTPPEPFTTTEPNSGESLSTIQPVGQQSWPLQNQPVKDADKTPASRLLTNQQFPAAENENFIQRQSKGLFETTTTIENGPSSSSASSLDSSKNPFAMEINGGLIASTAFPYFQDDSSLELTNRNYFSADDLLDGVGTTTSAPATTTSEPNYLHNDYGDNDQFTTTQSPPPQTTTTISFDLQPPNPKQIDDDINTRTVIDENDLQRAQSQSFLAGGGNRNSIQQQATERRSKAVATTIFYTGGDNKASSPLPGGHYITHKPEDSATTIPDSGKFTLNPWSTFSYTVFLDPLTINDGLATSAKQKLDKTVTPSPNTYLPRSTQSLLPGSSGAFDSQSRASTTPSTISSVISRVSRVYQPPSISPLSSVVTRNDDDNRNNNNNNDNLHIQPPTADYMEVMQKKANEIFGQLNDTSASQLMNVMRKAHKNKTVRKLILLLIQTCEDDYNNHSVDESRNALLQALIGMNGAAELNEEDDDLQIVTTRGRSSRRRQNKGFSYNPDVEYLHSRDSDDDEEQFNRGRTPTTPTPITTFRRPLINSRQLISSTTTIPSTGPQYLPFVGSVDLPSTTSTTTTTTTTPAPTTTSTTTTTPAPTTTTTTTTPAPTTTRTTTLITTTLPPLTTTRQSRELFLQSQDQVIRRKQEQASTTITLTTTKQPRQLYLISQEPIARRKQRQDQPLPDDKSSKRIVKDLDALLVQPYSVSSATKNENIHSDTRALDLLRSLYSLAGGFGKR